MESGRYVRMIVVPFIALCFSAPVAMLLCLVWLAFAGHANPMPTSREMSILVLATVLISLALALLVRPVGRRRGA